MARGSLTTPQVEGQQRLAGQARGPALSKTILNSLGALGEHLAQ